MPIPLIALGALPLLKGLFGGFGDNKSYLYKGKKKNELTQEEKQLERLYDQIDRPGHRITSDQFFNSNEYAQFLESQYGSISSSVPPGSQIVSQTPNRVEFKDKEGFTHVLTRKPGSKGQVSEETDRPNILPSTQDPRINSTLDAAVAAITQAMGVSPEGIGKLGNLSTADKALLDSITQADLGQIRKQFTTQGGQLVAQLYGKGMNQSSLANDAVVKLQQEQGIVESRVMADAAAREIQAREFLTNLATGTGADVFKSILGGDTSRAIASGQIGLGQKQLDLEGLQGARNYELGLNELELKRKAQSPWRSILSTVASLGAAAIPGLMNKKSS